MTDQEIIMGHGGPAKVAELLGLDKAKGGVQRVQNWMARGIPARMKLERPDLFLPGFSISERDRQVPPDGKQSSEHPHRRASDPLPSG